MHNHDHDQDDRIGLGVIRNDLAGYDQGRDLAGYLVDKSHYIGLENPDQRSFTFIN